jgi:hypothetical protein
MGSSVCSSGPLSGKPSCHGGTVPSVWDTLWAIRSTRVCSSKKR